jgi:cytochrome P450
MRYFGAVRGTARFASTDIEYRDVLFPAGTFVSVGLAEANRDPQVFSEPGSFDITAPKSDQPQLTFGSGIHYCLGQALARAELQEALPLLARRLPNLRLDGPTTWKPEGVGIFGPASMPITFDPGH